MSLFSMEIPETHAELVDWLEHHLVGLDLAALVAELAAVHAAVGPASKDQQRGEPDATSAVTLLGGHIPEVMDAGLTVLETQQVRALLQHPRSLLELQELVLTSGGAHWDKRMEETAGDEFQKIAETGWRRMKLTIAPPVGLSEGNGQISAAAADTVSGDAPTEVAPPTLRMSEAREQRAATPPARSLWPAVLGTAAMFLLGAFGLQQAGMISLNLGQDQPLAQNTPPHNPPAEPMPTPAGPEPTAPAPPTASAPAPPSGWGWDRPGAIPNDVPPNAYLATLAHGADEWFNKRPTDPEGVRKRISDFRKGCSTLIASSHEPLAEEDRTWLVEKCKKWRDRLDDHLAALDAGEDPLAVRAAADETVSKLIKAMRARADGLA